VAWGGYAPSMLICPTAGCRDCSQRPKMTEPTVDSRTRPRGGTNAYLSGPPRCGGLFFFAFTPGFAVLTRGYSRVTAPRSIEREWQGSTERDTVFWFVGWLPWAASFAGAPGLVCPRFQRCLAGSFRDARIRRRRREDRQKGAGSGVLNIAGHFAHWRPSIPDRLLRPGN
jgi:hypothetical protein